METYFNQNLKLMRETCGFSQEELSEKLGLKRAVISTYERGANVPKFGTLIKLRMLFEIGIDDMIFTRLGVELEFKPINKLRDGKDVKTGESNCTICGVVNSVCPDPMHHAMEIGLADKCPTCGAE